MQLLDGQPVYSASDLVGFLACEHLTELERAALAGLTQRPHLDDPELDVLRERGLQHEARYLAELVAAGRSVTTIDMDAYDEGSPGERLRAAAAATVDAMAWGVDVIYQATFFDGRWRGHADFLLRVDSAERPSVWGPYHYEVADTKLARHVKASAVLQICSYIDQLTRIQEVQPETLHVALGGSAHVTEPLRVADYMAYYRAAKARFEAAVGAEAPPAAYPPAATYPDPVSHCDVCRWVVGCRQRRRDDDHLSLVARISGRQRRALLERGIGTMAQLGALPLPLDPQLDGTSPAAVVRVREQARIQVQGRDAGRLLWELLLPGPGDPIEPERGLAILPPPSPGDLFFDIEGDPYALEDGLDYLFGVMEVDGTWHAIWSTDGGREFNLDGEKRAFEELIDLVVAQLERHPDAHVYHYAAYEPTALKRLMGRHATREDEVDRLLRGGRLVDLHRAVRQGIRASVESYSIKKLEPLYGFQRTQELRDAGSSIVEFEQYLELGREERPGSDVLARIEAYNRDDVVSNRLLRDWLEVRRTDLAELTSLEVPRPGPRESAPSEALSERQRRVAEVETRLTAGVPEQDRTDDQQARWLLAQLLSWHRREDKSFWWLYFHLMNDLTDLERIEANEPLAGLEYEGVIGEEGRSYIHRYRFPVQEHDVRVGGGVRDPATGAAPGTVVAIDEANRTVDLKRKKTSLVPHPTALVPYDHYDTDEHQDALLRIGDWVAENGLDGDGPYQAARDLLLRRAPRVGQRPGGDLRIPGESDLDAARRLASQLEGTTLAIQGPPGAGKTFAGSRMVVDLVAAGCRVGIAATSHKVVGNFLSEICKAATEAGLRIPIIQKADDDQGHEADNVTLAGKNEEVIAALADRSAMVGAGTSWLWSRADMADSVDVLFVDEAGQMSLANVIAISQAARSVVLLGDPQQLNQPLQGTHPPGAERSALAHLLNGRSTIRGELGLFMERTWRLHPDLCGFTSTAFYDSRLLSEDRLRVQVLRGAAPADGTGPRLVPVAHAGNDNESPEEAAVVAQIARSLVEGGARWTDQDGNDRPITWDQVLIVTPYNAQVGAIQKLLPDKARVGTVDKFQGQEAPISIYSMTSSSAEDAPRGMDFLYSRNRLNVATSRARCVAVVVASPELVRVRARTPEQMRLANALCLFVEMAREGAGGRSAIGATQ